MMNLAKTMGLGLACLHGLTEVTSLSAASPPARPNVLLILADDLGYMDVGFNNPNAFYETPHLDALAKRSVRFTDAYAASPVCSPTRSSILTGQYPARTGNTEYFHGPNGFAEGIPKDYDPARHGHFGRVAKHPVHPAPYLERLADHHTTLAEALKKAGYATMHAGKWHLGGKGSSPEDHGFDVNKGGTDRGAPNGGNKYFSPYCNPKLEPGPEGEHLPDRLASEVCSFIKENKDGEFFINLAFYSVHTPLMGRPDLVEKYLQKKQKLGLTSAFESEPPRRNRTVQNHAVYAAMVEAMDQAVGKVIACLDEQQLTEDTLIIFFSDNGGLSTSEGLPTSNLPYRAGKGWMYEGGIREPLLILLPGAKNRGKSCDEPVISTDFYPTILEACGLPALPEQHIDGKSLLPLLNDPDADLDRGQIFWHYPHWGNQGGIPAAAIREGDWKYIHYFWGKQDELFNLAKDPGERNDLASKETEKATAMKALLKTFLEHTGARLPSPNPNHRKPFNTW
jgi:arylsulfatase A-like enzyme